ncbi:probable manganese-transporting ATPase PDR2 [Tanacetum coccineum]|uniref:Probable manganese-transporting ATPase PDR2 n=1 Tax=Tanacetum coccineum TaxID=301880 RepID=A0ABQ4ZCP0_9ASTR
MLLQTSAVSIVIPYVKVFARVAPEQKELIMTIFNSYGRITLMYGDGTNDVEPLKQAHVGVALMNAIPPTSTGDKPSSETEHASEAKPTKPKKPKSAAEPSSGSVTPAANNRHLTPPEVHNDLQYKLRMVANDSTIKTLLPSLMDIRNSSKKCVAICNANMRWMTEKTTKKKRAKLKLKSHRCYPEPDLSMCKVFDGTGPPFYEGPQNFKQAD